MSDYMPGAVQSPQPGGVTLDTSLPPRFVWHITWDKLDANGNQPAFSAVANYLKNVGYCPHIMWNPFTGEMEQYYPASVGSRALAYNDQDGAACVQVEIFFTPGCVVNGIKYNTVADTPLNGWAELLAWADSLGVPRTWPMGAPQWQNNPRDVGTWNNNAGHYGHCNSPGDTHTDPGPMPPLTGTITTQSATITPKEWYEMALDQQTKLDINEAVWGGPGIPLILNNELGHGEYAGTLLGAMTDRIIRQQIVPLRQEVAALQGKLASLPAAVLNQNLGDGTTTNLAGILVAINAKPAGVTNVTGVAVDVDALVARLKAELPAAQFEYFKTQITKP